MLFSRLRYYLSSIPTLLTGVKNWPQMLALSLRLPIARPLVIELRDGGRYQVRTPMDVWVLKEACLDRQYQRASVEIEDGWNVLDVGAGLGDFAISVARAHPECQLYAYEPFPESYQLLKANLNINIVNNLAVFPYALAAESGAMSLHLVSPEAVQHSTASAEQAQKSIQVQSITLEQALDELGAPFCDYMKMDCEGAEYDILFNTSESALRCIRHVCLEYHDGVTQFSHQDLVEFFARYGFQVRLTPNPVHRHLGLLYAANPQPVAREPNTI